MFVAEVSGLLIKFVFFLSYVPAMCYPRVSYNVTVLLLIDESSDKFAPNDLDQMLRNDTFARKSEVINFIWLKANHTEIDRSQGGVLGALSFIQNHFTTVHGVIIIDITKEKLAFSSLLENVNILTTGLFQDDEILLTKENPGEFTKVTFPSVYLYVTSAWRIIKKHRWKTICLTLSANYEGKTFADQMRRFALQEKWEILKITWLMDETIGKDTKTELGNMLRHDSDVIVMHGRLGRLKGRFFELIQELGVRQYKTVWIVTEITTNLATDSRNLPEGLLKISLKKPEQYHDYSIYEKALQDALLLFQLSFEESVEEFYSESKELKGCERGMHSKKLWKIARRRMAQKSLSGKTLLFDQHSTKDMYSTFTIWNLKKDGSDEKKWFAVGMGASTGLALETYTSPSGKSIKPVLELPQPIVTVAVNEYPPFVYKKYIDEKGCVGSFVPCYENTRVNISDALVEKKFCCYGASLDFLAFLQRDLNFEARLYFNPDGQYGVLNDRTGQWNGIVQELIEKRAMLSLEMGLNTKRAEVISFAHPTLLLELGILIKKSDTLKVFSRDSWLRPFSEQLWLSLMGTSCIVFIMTWWLDRKSPQGHYRRLEDSGKEGFTLLDSISYVGGVAFGKDIGAEMTPLSTSSRLVSYIYSFLALIMINTYCANLMAFLLEENVGLPITGINDPKLTSDPPVFKVGAVRGSNEEDYFKRHIESSFRKIYEVNLRKNSVPSLETGVEHMREGKIQGLIGDYLSLSQIANTDKKCSFKLLKDRSFKSGYGFAVRKNSPWLQDISLSVLTHQENGTVQSIVKRWFPESICSDIKPRELESTDFVGLFCTVIAVTVFSLVALLAEMLTLFALVKFGNRLGPLGRFLKRFLFNVKRGEEDQTLVQYERGLMTTKSEVTRRNSSHQNNGSVEIFELERKIASLR